MISTKYDKFQFATATVKALTSKVNLSDTIVGIDVDDDNLNAVFCSEYSSECLKRMALNYDFATQRNGNSLADTVTYAMDVAKIRDENQGHGSLLHENPGKTTGDSFEFVGSAKEALYSSAITALTTAQRTYKVTVCTGKGMFAGTDANIFLTLHDKYGNSSKEYELSADLTEHAGPENGPPNQRLATQDDKTFTFEKEKVDYFFIEEYAKDPFGLDADGASTLPPLGVLDAVTVRCEESGSAKVKFTTDASILGRLHITNIEFGGWDLEWIGVTDLAIGGHPSGANCNINANCLWNFLLEMQR